MLVRLAHRLHRQERHGQVVWQQLVDTGNLPLRDAGVGEDGKMRPVLFDGRNRKHGDPVGGVRLGEVVGAHFVPETAGKVGHVGIRLSGDVRARRVPRGRATIAPLCVSVTGCGAPQPGGVFKGLPGNVSRPRHAPGAAARCPCAPDGSPRPSSLRQPLPGRRYVRRTG